MVNLNTTRYGGIANLIEVLMIIDRLEKSL